MTQLKRSLAIAAVVAVSALAAAAPASAQNGFVVDGPYTVHQGNGIIAILIGLAQTPFTPPLGSDKGS
jgi:hypothetical protein